MKNVWKVKADEYKNIYGDLVCSEWIISDLPFNMRSSKLDCINFSQLPLDVNEVDNKVILIDKLAMLFSTLSNLPFELLKTLTIFINPTIKGINQTADILIVRYNRVYVIQFAYDLITLRNYLDLKDNKVIYVLRQIEQELKRSLPSDTIVRTFLFNIKNDNDNKFTSKRLSADIEDFFSRITSRELLRLIV